MTDAAPEETQDKPDEQPAPPSAEDKGPEAAQAEPFTETFDPANLPEELRPAYKQLQGAATRKFQEAAALRQPDAVAEYLRTLAPEVQEQVLERIGIQLQGDEEFYEEDEFPDPDAEIRRELEELREWKQGMEQGQQDERLEDWLAEDIGNQISGLSDSTGRKFDEKESLAIGQIAFDRALASGQPPDVSAAYELIYGELLPAERKRWVDSKRSPQAPSGSSASHTPDLDKSSTRRDYLAQRYADILETQ
jgi:hypothetical protein